MIMKSTKKIEKETNDQIKLIKRDRWKHYIFIKFFYETVCSSIAFLDNLRMDKTNINALVQSIESCLHFHTQKSIFN